VARRSHNSHVGTGAADDTSRDGAERELAMKRAVVASLFLLLMAATSLFAAPAKLVDDVIRMSKKGISDDVIVAFIDAAPDRAPLSADDVILLSQSGVSRNVIQALLEPPAADEEPTADSSPQLLAAPGEPPTTDPNPAPDAPGCVTFEPPVALYEPDPPYPGWLWDPYWYMPQLDTRTDRGPTAARAGAGGTVAAVPGTAAHPDDTPAPRPQASPRSENPPSRDTTARRPEPRDHSRGADHSGYARGGGGGGSRHR
jgi:hypothetical protein